MFISEVCISDS